MNIGIIVYSFSGHTLLMATKLREKLAAAGHQVTLERLETVQPGALSGEVAALKSIPAVDAYDGLVLGTPVRGGTVSRPVVNYLERIPSLEGKRVVCLAAGFFPAQWGQNQALAQLKAICEAKGATVCGLGSVGWFSLNRKRQIPAVVNRLSDCFASEGEIEK